MLRRLIFCLILCSAGVAAQVPRPEEVFGFRPGEDYKLADYEQMREYYRRLEASSERIRVFDIGPTAEGQLMMLAIISSAANLRRAEEYREISEKLARARIDKGQALRLAEEGKTIVWIDGGLHATEVGHAQHSPELAYRVVSEESPEMRFIRENVILLQLPVLNPDGLNIVARWYKRNLGTEFETGPLPRLYHKYVGHDNNRDFYMSTQPETRNVNRVLYEQWYPQIVHNHHQRPPFPARIFIPPFAPPMNPKIPALVLRGIDLVGSAMSSRFEAEGKAGVVSRMNYTTWWNGGMRTAPYFHNMVGILTETALYEYATPHEYTREQLPETFPSGLPALEPSADYPNPWQGGSWRLQDAVDYMMTASLAVLDVAARHRNQWLYNIYQMGKRAIARGQTEAPRAYLISPEQHDPSAALALIKALRRGGVDVEQAEADFQVRDHSFPRGTFVISTAQAFRPYILDLMEPQKYPERRLYPGGPPLPPYDITGWTLPIQMGVKVERANGGIEVAARQIRQLSVPEPPAISPQAQVYLIDRRRNTSYGVVNRLLARAVTVHVSTEEVRQGGRSFPAGTFVLGREALSELRRLSQHHRVPVYGLPSEVQTPLSRLSRPRIGIYRSAVANSDEGWTRWVLDQYAFDYDSVLDEEIRAGNLRDRFEVIVLPSQRAESMRSGHRPGSVPQEYAGGMGIEGFAQLKLFTEQGGVLVALDAACELPVNHFDVLVRNVLKDSKPEDFYCPGSLLRIRVDSTDPVGYGMPEESAAFFVKSGAFALGLDRDSRRQSAPEESREKATLKNVVSYADDRILLSGWILGEEKILGRSAVVRASLGRGQVVMLGFRTQFRGQPHGTFKLLFNSIYLGGMERH